MAVSRALIYAPTHLRIYASDERGNAPNKANFSAGGGRGWDRRCV